MQERKDKSQSNSQKDVKHRGKGRQQQMIHYAKLYTTITVHKHSMQAKGRFANFNEGFRGFFSIKKMINIILLCNLKTFQEVPGTYKGHC